MSLPRRDHKQLNVSTDCCLFCVQPRLPSFFLSECSDMAHLSWVSVWRARSLMDSSSPAMRPCCISRCFTRARSTVTSAISSADIPSSAFSSSADSTSPSSAPPSCSLRALWRCQTKGACPRPDAADRQGVGKNQPAGLKDCEGVMSPLALRLRWRAGDAMSPSADPDAALSPSRPSGRSARWDANERFLRRPSAVMMTRLLSLSLHERIDTATGMLCTARC